MSASLDKFSMQQKVAGQLANTPTRGLVFNLRMSPLYSRKRHYFLQISVFASSSA